MAVGESSLPWGTAADDPDEIPPMYQERWRSLFGGALGDGIVNDYAGDALQVVTDGTSTITVQAGEAVVRGVHYRLSADLDLDLDASGTPPTSGTRIDRIVLRYDPSAQEITAVVNRGTIGSGAPALEADDTGLWDFELAQITRTNTTAATAPVDRRHHKGVVVLRQVGHPVSAAVGTVVINPDGTYSIRTLVAGTPTWVGSSDADAEAWTPCSLASGLVADSFAELSWRITGRWMLQIHGAVEHSNPTSFFPAGAQLTIGPGVYDFGSIGEPTGPIGGRLFPVVLEANGISGSMAAPVVSTGRMRSSGSLTVWIPTGVVGCNRVQFNTDLKIL